MCILIMHTFVNIFVAEFWFSSLDLVMNIKFISLECDSLLNIEKQSRKTTNIDLLFTLNTLHNSTQEHPVHISYTNHIFKR